MRYRKNNQLYRCVFEGAESSCLLGLEFSDEFCDVFLLGHETKYSSQKYVEPNNILSQVLKAKEEKEKEYKKTFNIKTIEYVKYDNIPLEYIDTIYYTFACRIIDRIMNFPEYEGND
jgi:hypothetical protein